VALLFLTRKKQVALLFKPTPILNNEGKLLGILGNLLDEGSMPVIAKIDIAEVNSCFTTQNNDIPKEFCPKTPLIVYTVKDTAWETALNEIALCALPTLVPISFGIEIQACNYNDEFIDEMEKNSPTHGFWVVVIANVFEQTKINSDINTIIQRLIASKVSLTPCRDPCCTATKNLHNAMVASGPSIETSLVGNKYKIEQVSVNSFFHCNPTPARIIIIDEDNNPTKKEAQIPIHGTSTYANATGGNNVPTAADVTPPWRLLSNPCAPRGQRLLPTHWQQLPPSSLPSSLRPCNCFQLSNNPKNLLSNLEITKNPPTLRN
jgi:hypothetical protein